MSMLVSWKNRGDVLTALKRLDVTLTGFRGHILFLTPETATQQAMSHIESTDYGNPNCRSIDSGRSTTEWMDVKVIISFYIHLIHHDPYHRSFNATRFRLHTSHRPM